MRSAFLEGVTWIMKENSNSPSPSDPTGDPDSPIGMQLTPAGEAIAAMQDEIDDLTVAWIQATLWE